MPVVVKRKLKKKNFFKFVTFLIVTPILFIGIINYISLQSNTNQIKKEISEIQKAIKVENLVDDEETIIIPPSDNISKFDRYYSYINLSLIDIDFSKLKKINSDAIGWLEIKGTKVSIPIVIHENENFYQNHSFYKKKNSYGWPNLISENNKEITNKTIIEGTNKNSKLLLNDIKTLFEKEWQQNKNNHIIKYVTKDYTSLWQIVSITKDTEELGKNEIVKKSLYDFKTSVSEEDKILIIKNLSDKKNYTVYAKLIKVKYN